LTVLTPIDVALALANFTVACMRGMAAVEALILLPTGIAAFSAEHKAIEMASPGMTRSCSEVHFAPRPLLLYAGQ
jgi:hypothetical protein